MHFIYFIFCYTALGHKSVAFKHAIEIHFDLTLLSHKNPLTYLFRTVLGFFVL